MLAAMIDARYAHMAWEALHLPPSVAKVEGHYSEREFKGRPFVTPPWDGVPSVLFPDRIGAA